MAEKTSLFHIVLNSQGSLSGPELIQQVEDGINDIGKLAQNSNEQSSNATMLANQAVETANSAQSTANNALANSESAIEQVQTLAQTVNGYDQKITDAVSQASSAVAVANTAVNVANASETSASNAQQAAEYAKTAAETAAQNASSSATAAQSAQVAAETAQTEATEAKQSAFQAQQQAQQAQQAAEQASLNSNIIHAYDGTLTNDGTVEIADLVPATGQQQDLVVDNTGLIYQITAVNEGQATVLQTGATIAGFISYSQAQSLTDEQKTQARANLDAVSQTELMSILNEYIDGTQTNDIQS